MASKKEMTTTLNALEAWVERGETRVSAYGPSPRLLNLPTLLPTLFAFSTCFCSQLAVRLQYPIRLQ